MGPLLIRHGCHIDSSLTGWALGKEKPKACPESPQLRQWPPRSSAGSVGIGSSYQSLSQSAKFRPVKGGGFCGPSPQVCQPKPRTYTCKSDGPQIQDQWAFCRGGAGPLAAGTQPEVQVVRPSISREVYNYNFKMPLLPQPWMGGLFTFSVFFSSVFKEPLDY